MAACRRKSAFVSTLAECDVRSSQALRGGRVRRNLDRVWTDCGLHLDRHHHGGPGRRLETEHDIRQRESCAEVMTREIAPAHSTIPFATSHFSITSAISALFFSCISMWELPLMPMSGRLMRSTLPPAALMACAYSV